MSDYEQRYSRQIRFPAIGLAGQRRLAQMRVLVLGCGALGAASAEIMCRAGLGSIRLVDRDFVELSNLQRQSLYTEDDAHRCLPKAVAAAEHLRAINSACGIEPVIADARASTIGDLIAECDLVLDGTDNFPTRHLINEACCRQGIPWVYGACVGAYGVCMPIVPQVTPCLRCIQDQLPGVGESPTCDSAGIVGAIVHIVAGWQSAEAIKFLVGGAAAIRHELWASDVWAGTFQHLQTSGWKDAGCSACGESPSYPVLSAGDQTAIVLCGRDTIQLQRAAEADLIQVRQQVGTAVLLMNEYLVRWQDGDLVGTCFRNGRVLVQGTADAAVARAFCDRWLG
jgi:molybdopterin/thiamine biosynthesis adenylyltransferase